MPFKKNTGYVRGENTKKEDIRLERKSGKLPFAHGRVAMRLMTLLRLIA